MVTITLRSKSYILKILRSRGIFIIDCILLCGPERSYVEWSQHLFSVPARNCFIHLVRSTHMAAQSGQQEIS